MQFDARDLATIAEVAAGLDDEAGERLLDKVFGDGNGGVTLRLIAAAEAVDRLRAGEAVQGPGGLTVERDAPAGHTGSVIEAKR